MKIGLLIYTHNRIDDARINMEIARYTWTKNEFFKDLTIVHAYNGETSLWSEPYLENNLIFCENGGHFSGAANLLDNGIQFFKEHYSDIAYVIIVAADTWIVRHEYLQQIITTMCTGNKSLATCGWGSSVSSTGLWSDAALDFFIIDLKWAICNNFFPLRYKQYISSYSELLMLLNITVYLEQLLLLRFRQALFSSIEVPSENLHELVLNHEIHLMKEREPINVFDPVFERRMHFPKIGMISHHDPLEKQFVIRNYNVELGKYGQFFLATNNISYYNEGFNHSTYIKNGLSYKYT